MVYKHFQITGVRFMSRPEKTKRAITTLISFIILNLIILKTVFGLSPQSLYDEKNPPSFFGQSDELIDLINGNSFINQFTDSNLFTHIHTEKKITKFGPDNFVIQTFAPYLGCNPKTDCFSALYLDLKADCTSPRKDSEETEKTNGSLINITLYDTRPAGSNTLLIGHLGIQDFSQEEIIITQSMISFNFEYYEGLEKKFRILHDALKAGLSNATHSFPLEDPEFIKNIARTCAGLTQTDLIQCLTENFSGKILPPGEIPPLKNAFKEKRAAVVRENKFFPSQLYQKKSFKAGGDILIKGLNTIISIAGRTGYKQLMLGVSMPDGFQNYLLYSQYGFKPVLTDPAVKQYYEQITEKYKSLRAEKTEKSLFSIMWRLCDEFPNAILPMILELNPGQTSLEPKPASENQITRSA